MLATQQRPPEVKEEENVEIKKEEEEEGPESKKIKTEDG